MMRRSRSRLRISLALALAAMASVTSQAQHGHMDAGATGTNPGDALNWANGADFVASSGYVHTLTYTNAGRYAGYFQGNITLTSLPATLPNAGPAEGAAALGSYLQFSLACIDAPPGGTFGYWDGAVAAPTVSLARGQVATNFWRLSQGNGAPGSDPYGHIHGRRFTATKPGLYQVAFRLIDTSTNGPGGGPIHAPSQPLPMWFQTGVNVLSVEPDFEDSHVHVHFIPPAAALPWQLEFTEQPGPGATWKPAGNPVVGADRKVEVRHEGPPGQQRFYRVRSANP